MVSDFLGGQDIIFWKILIIHYYTYFIFWIWTKIWYILLCKITQLQESEVRPTGWTLSSGILGLFLLGLCLPAMVPYLVLLPILVPDVYKTGSCCGSYH